MAALQHVGADAPGQVTPRNDEGPTLARVAPLGCEKHERPDCLASSEPGQAAELIEGELYASAYLTRLQAGTAQPGELAVILAFLTGEMLHGACRLIEKALEGRHHA